MWDVGSKMQLRTAVRPILAFPLVAAFPSINVALPGTKPKAWFTPLHDVPEWHRNLRDAMFCAHLVTTAVGRYGTIGLVCHVYGLIETMRQFADGHSAM